MIRFIDRLADANDRVQSDPLNVLILSCLICPPFPF